MKGVSNHATGPLVLPGAASAAPAAGVTLAARSANAARVSFAVAAPGETIDQFIIDGYGQESSLARSGSVAVQVLSLATPGTSAPGRSSSERNYE